MPFSSHDAVHLVQAVLITAAISLTVPRLFMDYEYQKKEHLLALTIGAKSLVVIAYQVATEHVGRFRRWHSYKANAILNCLEVVFWSAVTFFVIDSNTSKCKGINCTFSWIVVVLGILITLSQIYTSAVAVREFRQYRAGMLHPKEAVLLDDDESAVSTRNVHGRLGG